MEYPERKHTRLKNFDYGQDDYYFVTIHTDHNEYTLSDIIPAANDVGRGLAPAAGNTANIVGRGLAPAAGKVPAVEIKLTEIGKISEQQLFALEKRYKCVKIDKYVIMPNHIHTVIIISENYAMNIAAGASPRPTLTEIIGAFKSLTTRICNQNDDVPGRKIFQTSFYDRIIRNEKEYFAVLKYIEDNPIKWWIEHQSSPEIL